MFSLILNIDNIFFETQFEVFIFPFVEICQRFDLILIHLFNSLHINHHLFLIPNILRLNFLLNFFYF